MLAAGVITIHIPDFMKQLTTFRTSGDSRVGAMEGFGRLFLGQLWEVYGRFFRDDDDDVTQEVRVKRSELAEHFVELNFMPQDACRWLSPSELRTFAAQTLSQIFGNYADKRELQKVFDSNLIVMPPADQPLAEGEDFWFDYTADIGDGFEATYTVAALLGQETLARRGPRRRAAARADAGARRRPGVPAASSKAYEDRTVGPYRSAMPEATPQPLMLALPGNHDWYDGLTAFLRLFTQDRMIGGWRTEQKRSYFTVQLPHRWWLVGLDSQLDTYFDDPQLKYFEETLTANLQPGDSVIVCCATPAWVKAWSGHPDAFNGLEWFERNFVSLPSGTGQQRPRADGRPGPAVAERRQAPLHPLRGAARGPRCPRGHRPADGDRRHRRCLPRRDPRHGQRGQAAAPGLAQLARGRQRRDVRAAAGDLPEPRGLARLGDAAGAAVAQGVDRAPQPGCVHGFAMTHFILFLMLLLIFWQGIRASETGAIIDAYLSATPRELFGSPAACWRSSCSAS